MSRGPLSVAGQSLCADCVHYFRKQTVRAHFILSFAPCCWQDLTSQRCEQSFHSTATRRPQGETWDRPVAVEPDPPLRPPNLHQPMSTHILQNRVFAPRNLQDVLLLALRPQELLVLACDGLFERCSNQESRGTESWRVNLLRRCCQMMCVRRS